MEVKLNIDSRNIGKIINLAMGGCVELLNYPELCTLVDKTDGEKYLYNHKRDYNSWASFNDWGKGFTLVHALAFKFHPEILDYPEYLKLKNKNGVTPLHLLSEKLLPEDTDVMKKILRIEGLEKLTDSMGTTPLHYIAMQGFIPILDYPGIGKIESPEWNSHGTPMTHLYRNATTDLEKLLKHPDVLTEYKTHGTPLEELARNKKFRPTVKLLKEYGFKMDRRWHSSKKLDAQVIGDILSVPKSIRFMIY